jgi:hypothetical protein
MTSSQAKLFSLILALGLMAGCAGPSDIDRTQPDKIDTSIFFNPDGTGREFYYRKTTIGVPPTSAYAFEGMMGDLLKVRFEFSSPDGKYLVGHRAYDYSPGSQSPSTSGQNNTDTPFLVFAVTSHFDVKREYNPATGEQTNVISENTTDRPWNERQYMRVDWSKNLAEAGPDKSAADPMNAYLPSAESVDTGFTVGEGDQPYINPDRPIISHDYVDFATKELRTPDYAACLKMFDTYDDASPYNCGPAEITYRNSLLPVPATSEYEPLSYPDQQALLDNNGEPFRIAVDPSNNVIPCTADALAAAGLSGDDCFTATVDQFSKFGFFRTVRPTYDPKVGATEQGRQYYINRWNIWAHTIKRDGNGNPTFDGNGNPVRLPYDSPDRDLRTITYYLNVDFPDDQQLRDAANEVVGDWNQAMKETVAALRLTQHNNVSASMSAVQQGAQGVPDIFVLKPNGCSLQAVQAFVTQNPDIANLVANKVSKDTLDLGSVTASNLQQACSALSAVTDDRPDGDAKKFVWQRNGDLRYSFIFWVDRPQVDGPLGYGPSSQDPETGEIISVGAYIYGAALNTYAQFASDSVNLANGQISVDDLLSGKTISDVLAASTQRSRARQAETVTDAARAQVMAKFQGMGATRDARLAPLKVGAGIDDQGLASVKGTSLQSLLLNDDILPGVIPGYRPGDTPPANAFDLAMAKPWLSSQAAEERHARFQTLAQNGCVYLGEFADDAILGTALDLNRQGLTADQLYTELRATIFRGLTDHEMGHTMGLRHNFSASTDALNYADDYWRIRRDVSPDQWEANSLSEYAYASVMDYGSRFNSDVRGLGRYDKAAIRFGYGQLIDTMSAAQDYGNRLANDMIYNDYTKIPAMVGGLDIMSTGSTQITPYGNYMNYLFGGPLVKEHPYKFCGDEFEGNFDCKTWDKGANQREIIANVNEMYRNYYVFNAYKRGRTTWQIDDYLNRLESRYFNRYQQAFQFFFFFGNQVAGSDFFDDLFLASMDSLNSLGEILQTPQPGLQCPTAQSPNLMAFPIDPATGLQDTTLCLAGQPQLTFGIPDAKPYFIAFSPDYYYRITRTGSLYEKLEALFTLTSTESRFFRVDTFADANRYSINYYRVFRDEVIKLLSGVIRDDPMSYSGIISNGTTFEPRPVVDPNIYGALNPPTPDYAQPTALHVDTPVNKTIQYWALLLGLGRLGSSWDATLDFQNFLAVSVVGADDDFTVGPGVPVKQFIHPTTGVVYHAPDGSTPRNIGAQIIDDLNTILGVQGVQGMLPARMGVYTDGSPLPDWRTAKAALDAASAGTDQAAYTAALAKFTSVDQLLAYWVDLIGDIRLFRKQIFLLNGVNP